MALGGNPKPQFPVACEAQSLTNTGDGGDQIGGGSKKDVSPLEAVGQRYALDGTIKQMTFVSDKHFSDLDDYLEHLRVKLTSTFLELLDDKHGINFWVAVYVRYSHPNKDLTDTEPIVLQSGKRIVTSIVVLAK